MKKNLALVVAFTIALSASSPVFAAKRDGGSPRDEDPISRIIRVIKKFFTPVTHEEIGNPHPQPPTP